MTRRLLAAFVGVVFCVSACGQRGATTGATDLGAPAGGAADADGDGIPDTWERDGVDYTWPVDGSKHHLDMKQLGASPRHKDIFVWVAWMDGATHTHRPNPSAIAMVTEAFAMANTKGNLDGVPGINLHIVLAPTPIPEQAVLGALAGSNYDWTEFDNLKKGYFPSAFGDRVFFCLFAHDFDADHHSGITKTIPGRDFMVTLGGFTNQVGGQYAQAGTFMHELGHALGLHHGGGDDRQTKPNYVSVMNYFFQLNGLTINGEQGFFDYSTFDLAAKESKLSEKTGLSTDPAMAKYGSYYWCAGDHQTIRQIKALSQKPVDWNCDDVIGGDVSTDVNGDDTVTDLSGASDWDRIVLQPTAANLGATPPSAPAEAINELTPTQGDRIPLFPVSNVQAEQSGTGVIVKWRRVPLDRVIAYKLYRSQGTRESLVATVENTASPSFVDLPPAKGPLKYSVAAVFAPVSYAAQIASAVVAVGNAVDRSNRRLWSGAPPLTAPFFNAIAETREVNRIREIAPKQVGRLEKTGITAEQNAATAFPKVLFETVRSDLATVVVK